MSSGDSIVLNGMSFRIYFGISIQNIFPIAIYEEEKI